MKLVYHLSFFGIYLSTNLKLQYLQYYCSRTYKWPEITPVATLLCLYRVLVIVCIVPFDCQGGIWLLGWMFGGGIYCSAYPCTIPRGIDLPSAECMAAWQHAFHSTFNMIEKRVMTRKALNIEYITYTQHCFTYLVITKSGQKVHKMNSIF